jgi:hypothetical protein
MGTTQNPASQSAVAELQKKFKGTGSIADIPRLRGPRVSEEVRGVIVSSPKIPLKRRATELGVPDTTLHYDLSEGKLHLFCQLSKEYTDTRVEIYILTSLKV